MHTHTLGPAHIDFGVIVLGEAWALLPVILLWEWLACNDLQKRASGPLGPSSPGSQFELSLLDLTTLMARKGKSKGRNGMANYLRPRWEMNLTCFPRPGPSQAGGLHRPVLPPSHEKRMFLTGKQIWSRKNLLSTEYICLSIAHMLKPNPQCEEGLSRWGLW